MVFAEERKPHPNSRQNTIEMLEPGESYSVAKRVDLTFGLSDSEKKKHLELGRGSLESMVHRARTKHRGRKYRVESFIGHASQDAAIFFVAVATRTL